MSGTPAPAPSRADHSFTFGETSALIAPLFGVPAKGLAYVVLIQTPDGRCDATSNIATTAEVADFLREALATMPGDGGTGEGA